MPTSGSPGGSANDGSSSSSSSDAATDAPTPVLDPLPEAQAGDTGTGAAPEGTSASIAGAEGASAEGLATYFHNQPLGGDAGVGNADASGTQIDAGSGDSGTKNPFTNSAATSGSSGPYVGRDVNSFTGKPNIAGTGALAAVDDYGGSDEISLDYSPVYPRDKGHPDAERPEPNESAPARPANAPSTQTANRVRPSPVGATSLLEQVEALIKYERSLTSTNPDSAPRPMPTAVPTPLTSRTAAVEQPRAAPVAPAPAPVTGGPFAPAMTNFGIADWTTQTEWADLVNPQDWIKPITSLDTGSRPLNFLLNKVLLPWSNLAAAVIDAPIGMLRDGDELAKHSRFGVEY
jgi:hypothetical protein